MTRLRVFGAALICLSVAGCGKPSSRSPAGAKAFDYSQVIAGLKDQDSSVRKAAAQAVVEQMPGAMLYDARPTVEAALKQESDPEVRAALEKAMKKINRLAPR